ncbi:DUF397 domain-containing protein [Streptomyces sp. RKAG293]|uniref:DUF397 domain-containing protein n=1 Tax=Streptomyces sp. RKAG293 TaxID=2893403 RepID=UPI00203332C3|nr:DUF397 domain-containing protein [Streptomyces sp. RKAG293]MCM2420314.1 DUF397 domain-containing protein [Streptomyces sp. RKAG293]
MSHIDDAATLPVTWWKSSASGTQSDCVECGVVDAQQQILAVRDSKNPTGPALLFSFAAVNDLVDALRRGEMQ